MNSYYDSKIIAAEGGRRLIITLPPGRGAMEYQIEMIANNDVFGLLAFRYMTTDAKPCIHYDINGLVTLKEYILTYGQGIRLLAETLMDISVSIGGLDKFLLEEKCLLLDAGLIFIDPARKGIKLVYLPVEPPEDKRITFIDLVMDLIGSFHPEDATGKLFCRRIIDEVKKPGFRYEAFTDFLFDILCFSDEKADAGMAGDARPLPAPPNGAVKPGARLPDGLSGSGGANNFIQNIRGLINNHIRPGNSGNDDNSHTLPDTSKHTPARETRRFAISGGGAKENDASLPRGALPKTIAVNNGRILPAGLSAAVVTVVYIGILSFIPHDLADGMIYRSAVLITALGAQMLLLKHFTGIGLSTATGNAAPLRGGEFAGAVQAASAIFEANMAAKEAADNDKPVDLWANSVAAGSDEPEDDYAATDGGDVIQPAPASFDSAPAPAIAAANITCASPAALTADATPSADIAPATAPVSPATDMMDCDMQTEVLPFVRHVDATLTIRDTMREFGVSLSGCEFTIGRKKEQSGLTLDNPAVGKLHAKLVKMDDHWYVKDLYSKNGTYLNNIKLEYGGQKILNTSDMITVANVDMIFASSEN